MTLPILQPYNKPPTTQSCCGHGPKPVTPVQPSTLQCTVSTPNTEEEVKELLDMVAQDPKALADVTKVLACTVVQKTSLCSLLRAKVHHLFDTNQEKKKWPAKLTFNPSLG